jgi:hypothetical protein
MNTTNFKIGAKETVFREPSKCKKVTVMQNCKTPTPSKTPKIDATISIKPQVW